MVGHTLVWHEQTGDWAFEHPDGTPLSRDELLAVMEDHISTVVGRYRGRVDGWDVVNEALADDGSLRDTPWLRIIGDDFVEHAFRFAHAADPDAELYYNDYGLERPEKRAGAVRLVRSLVEAGVPVAGVGVQTHMWMDWPTVAEMEAEIVELAQFGARHGDRARHRRAQGLRRAGRRLVATSRPARSRSSAATPSPRACPDRVQQELADRYAETFALFYRHRDKISRVTFWGVTDGDSWRNGWPYPRPDQLPAAVRPHGRPEAGVPGRPRRGPGRLTPPR